MGLASQFLGRSSSAFATPMMQVRYRLREHERTFDPRLSPSLQPRAVWDGPPRVTRSCCSWNVSRSPRPSNRLHGRFDRASLSRSLETTMDAPKGAKTSVEEGDRTDWPEVEG
jgi:hypothetical protein